MSINRIDPDVMEALIECEDYFDNMADAEYDQDGIVPNKEMRMLVMVRDAIKKLERSVPKLVQPNPDFVGDDLEGRN